MVGPNWSEKKVLKDQKWSRVYEADDGSAVRVSKFLTDQIRVLEVEIRNEWGLWSESERLSFAHAFSQKPAFSSEDERVLDFLMDAADERIGASIAVGLTRHSQRKRVLNFLLGRLESVSESKSNYTHALSILGDVGAIPALKALHDRLASSIKKGDRVEEGILLDFVSCCSALMKLEGTSAYADEIRPFLSHPNGAVRDFSRIFLQGGPPSHWES